MSLSLRITMMTNNFLIFFSAKDMGIEVDVSTSGFFKFPNFLDMMARLVNQVIKYISGFTGTTALIG